MEKTKKFYKVLERFKDELTNKLLVKIECDCGNVVVKPAAFTSWTSRTCGNQCPISKRIRSDAMKNILKPLSPKGTVGLSRVYDLYKRRAVKKRIEFSLSKEVFKELTSKPCFYCNAPPSMEYIHKVKKASARERENSLYVYNSLDRIDPNKGYTVDNVRPSCKCCNIMKWNHSEEFFKERVRIFYEFYFKNDEK